jgi:nitrate/nitrite-specific signal transduction histidine kinase
MEISNEKGKRVVGWDYAKNEVAQKAIRETKTKVCAELEKICPTEKSLNRMVKEMHNIFDKLEKDVAEQTQA